MTRPLHESSLRDYFLGLTSAATLDAQTRAAVTVRSQVEKDVHVREIEEDFLVTRPMILRLCEDAIKTQISADSLEDIAFVVLASDRFYLEDESLTEILHDWSQPKVNYPLTLKNLEKVRDWLLGNAACPALDKPPIGPTGTVVSVKHKVVV